jgi:hypothetical protein
LSNKLSETMRTATVFPSAVWRCSPGFWCDNVHHESWWAISTQTTLRLLERAQAPRHPRVFVS